MKTIYIIGTSWNVNNITDEEWRKIKKSDTIGLNFAYLKTDLKYLYSHYQTPILHSNAINHKSIKIYGKWKYGDCKPANETYILKPFEKSFNLEHNILNTTSNSAFEALHFAFKQKYDRIFMIGFNQRNIKHFYETKKYDWFYEDIENMLLNIKNIPQLARDKEMDVLKNTLLSRNENGFNKKFASKYNHFKTFVKYFEILRNANIEIFTNNKESIIYDAGAKYKTI